MANLQEKREDLILTDQHLAVGRRRVAAQIALIERMTKTGHDTTVARDLLRQLELTLKQGRVHRKLILNALAQG